MSAPTQGRYRVLGTRRYRGHEPGTEFEAELERGAERRAIARGNIELVERFEPTLPEGYTFPRGWLPKIPQPRNETTAERRFSTLERGGKTA
jgi:hypothetical protein